MKSLPPALLLAALALAGCTRDDTAYPSLGVRAVEKRGFAEPDTPPPVAVAPDPALDAKIAALASQLGTIAKGFDADAARAETAARAARGQAVGSEAWLTAQTLLAGLDDWRAQATSLVTDVEQLAVARAATLAPDYPALTPLAQRATGEAARQGATITRLAAALPAA